MMQIMYLALPFGGFGGTGPRPAIINHKNKVSIYQRLSHNRCYPLADLAEVEQALLVAL